MTKASKSSLLIAAGLYSEVAADTAIHHTIDAVVQLIVLRIKAGSKIFFAGNGGSAADAQHMAGEFVSRFMFDRNPLPAIALTTDTSILTAIANDYGYDKIFTRQLEALARPGDVLFGYSTSGNSTNIVNVLELARSMQVATVGLTGSGNGKMDQFSDYLLCAPSTCVPRVQEVHLLLGHTICELVEQQLFA